ncbi:Mpv17/PMP22 family protein [Metarhizium album ARSEF 1941]|uniref:Mpv17/PMP22 family protein n=1 Tax=Metarhizium album (strain ARSEF 1941) TaxID=1081103 RepID=A0A0B2WT37_METAS|nr:Mpv17/PMP22 family protein [Metarhizium album ARSEF 1941]KHN97203.1 Mpv17/PMP22 family protein [Metarhizium album ARSEF 1941]
MSLPRFHTAAARMQFRGLSLRHGIKPRAHSTSSSANKKGQLPNTKTRPNNTKPKTTSPTASAASSPFLPPIWQRLGPLTTAANAYSRSQRNRPYATQIVGAVVIYLCADLSAQGIGGREYDPKRTARTLLIGFVAAIPYFHWFRFLSGSFNYASKTLSIAAKVVVNQLFFTPTFSTYFFGAQALLSGETLEATVQRIRDTVPTSWLNSFKVWPAAVAFSMAFLPFEFRSIFSGVVAVGWQTYLSYLNRQAELLEEARMLAEGTVYAETAL